MQILKSLLKGNIRQYGMILALILIMIFFAITTNGVSLVPLNITNLLLQNGHILILAVGMLIVILTGNIDLSVGSVAAFVGAIAGIMMIKNDYNWIISSIAALGVGIAAGAWNGFWIAYVKVPPFIVTLGGMLLFRGLTLVVLKGASLGPFPDEFNNISSGFLPDIFGGTTLHILTIVIGIVFGIGYVISVILARRKKIRYNFEVSPLWVTILTSIFVIVAINLFTFTLARYRGFPNISLILFAVIIIYAFITRKTIFGRHIYAMGGNYEAAKLSGVKTKRMMFLIYTNMGLLSAVSGLVYAARLNSSTPKAGNLFELDAIAAAFIGGASASGGVGTVIGAVIGGLVMGVINNGMSLMSLGIDWQQVVKGLVLLLAVWFDIATKNRSK
ncbi:MAG: multiple monosaccharide ABC transporter permease [Candidatus Izemoplasmataceae bacterium]